MLAHNVYFQLTDASPEACQTLVEACKKYLSDHPGTLYFGAGVRAEGYEREVNDQEFHVGLHVIFEDRASHDAYQVHERHHQFIEENKANWAGVRVFDSEDV